MKVQISGLYPRRFRLMVVGWAEESALNPPPNYVIGHLKTYVKTENKLNSKELDFFFFNS